jgi:hypothetical protein
VTADAPVTLQWLGGARSAGPDADQGRALTAWARAHGVRLALPRDERPPAIPEDARSAAELRDEVERWLDRVRDAIAGRDADAAERGLATAESALRAHPELPQASWLMAEVERARASRFRRVPPVDEEAADRAWMRAEALDGGRVAGVGERAAATHPAEATLVFDRLPAIATLQLDGRPQPARSDRVATHEGPHAVRVTWGDAAVWAGWIDAPSGSSTLHLTVPAPPPCSQSDVDLATLVSSKNVPTTVDAAGVRCASWATALPGSRPTSVLVASCDAGRCGALLEWNAPSPGSWTWSPPAERPHAGWPSWATWGLVGAGAVIATSVVVVVATGVLQAPAAETRFVTGGVKTQ